MAPLSKANLEGEIDSSRSYILTLIYNYLLNNEIGMSHQSYWPLIIRGNQGYLVVVLKGTGPGRKAGRLGQKGLGSGKCELGPSRV